MDGSCVNDVLLDDGPRDSWHVDLGESWEIRLWCGALGCTERELREAVAAVGTLARDVRAHLAGSSSRAVRPSL